jgi:copper chaperone CopZ
MLTEKISVSDMTCHGCAGRVRNALLKEDGVVKVITSLDDHSAEVTFDEQRTTGHKLIQVLQTAGFLSAPSVDLSDTNGDQKCC